MNVLQVLWLWKSLVLRIDRTQGVVSLPVGDKEKLTKVKYIVSGNDGIDFRFWTDPKHECWAALDKDSVKKLVFWDTSPDAAAAAAPSSSSPVTSRLAPIFSGHEAWSLAILQWLFAQICGLAHALKCTNYSNAAKRYEYTAYQNYIEGKFLTAVEGKPSLRLELLAKEDLPKAKTLTKFFDENLANWIAALEKRPDAYATDAQFLRDRVQPNKVAFVNLKEGAAQQPQPQPLTDEQRWFLRLYRLYTIYAALPPEVTSTADICDNPQPPTSLVCNMAEKLLITQQMVFHWTGFEGGARPPPSVTGPPPIEFTLEQYVSNLLDNTRVFDERIVPDLDRMWYEKVEAYLAQDILSMLSDTLRNMQRDYYLRVEPKELLAGESDHQDDGQDVPKRGAPIRPYEQQLNALKRLEALYVRVFLHGVWSVLVTRWDEFYAEYQSYLAKAESGQDYTPMRQQLAQYTEPLRIWSAPTKPPETPTLVQLYEERSMAFHQSIRPLYNHLLRYKVTTAKITYEQKDDAELASLDQFNKRLGKLLENTEPADREARHDRSVLSASDVSYTHDTADEEYWKAALRVRNYVLRQITALDNDPALAPNRAYVTRVVLQFDLLWSAHLLKAHNFANMSTSTFQEQLSLWQHGLTPEEMQSIHQYYYQAASVPRTNFNDGGTLRQTLRTNNALARQAEYFTSADALGNYERELRNSIAQEEQTLGVEINRVEALALQDLNNILADLSKEQQRTVLDEIKDLPAPMQKDVPPTNSYPVGPLPVSAAAMSQGSYKKLISHEVLTWDDDEETASKTKNRTAPLPLSSQVAAPAPAPFLAIDIQPTHTSPPPPPPQHHPTHMFADPNATVFIPHRIGVAFLKVAESRSGGWRGFLKRTIAFFSGELNHVEPIFEGTINGQTALLACQVYFGESVQLCWRQPIRHYNTDYWVTYDVNFTPDEIQRFWHYCYQQVGKPFNTRGLYCNFIPVLRSLFGTSENDERTWMCSQLVMACLKRARPQEFHYYTSCQINPQTLRDIMDRHQCFSHVVRPFGSLDGRLVRL